MSRVSPPNDLDVLDGWKSIADYFGKSVRTAQRWRQEFGMPVHRLGGREGENVYAFRSELDAWRRQASRLGEFAASEQEVDDRARTVAPALRSDAPRRAGWSWLARSVGTVLLLAALGYAGWKAVGWRAAPGTRAPASTVAADRRPARWVVVGDDFHAFNAAGEQLWAYHPGPALATSLYFGHTDPARVPLPDLPTRVSAAFAISPVYISDLDGDGRRDVLLIAHAQDAVEGSTLHCLDADGRVQWTFKPRDALAFGGEDYGPPARLPWVTVSRDGRGAASIWISAEHSTWFPTWVYRLDASGKVVGRYGSNGRVNKIRFTSAGGRQFALLGGVNNERKTAAMAVFDVTRFGGAAPAETPRYRCDNCAHGSPEHYLVFPEADVSHLQGGMPFVADFAVQSSGEIVVSVQHHGVQMPGEQGRSLALTNYRLDASFRIQGAEHFAQYITVHDYYASLGRLDHRFDARLESSQLWPVLRWNGSGYDRIARPER